MHTVKIAPLQWLLVLVILSISGGANTPRLSSSEPEPQPTVRTAACSNLHVDLNNDSQADQVTLTCSTDHPQLEVVLSNHEALTLLLHTDVSAHSTVLAADIDHDGDIDLIVQGGPLPREVNVWLGDGAGGFQLLQSQEPRRLTLDWYTNHLAFAPETQLPFALISQHESPSELARGIHYTVVLKSRGAVISHTPDGIVALIIQHPSNRGPPLMSC